LTQHHLITGAAGFIGSHLVDRLLKDGHKVSGLDDFSLGREEHLVEARGHTRFFFQQSDLSSPANAVTGFEACAAKFGPIDLIWHLAANSNIPAGVADANVDFRNTLRTTFATLEAAKCGGVRKLAFASTSAIYGERSDILKEDSGPLLPISNYGACKLASEGLLSAAAETFLERIWVFRFPNVVGPRSTHGAIHDFIGALATRPEQLSVLGDGTQTKPYLHISELINAMCFIVASATDRRNVFNIGPAHNGTSVAFMAEQAVARVSPGTAVVYSGGDRGWVGDVPRFRYSTEKLAALGWKPKLSSNEAVIQAIDDIARQNKLIHA